jgi:HD-GYP domain-containing protein (c-di-GMP phosphodiesterase class II)
MVFNMPQSNKPEPSIQEEFISISNQSAPIADLVVGESMLGITPNLFQEINRKTVDVSRVSEMVQEIVRMVQYNFKASASSLLLLDEKKKELNFEVAEGKVGHQLKQIHMGIDSGIAGWVARNKEPLVINDVTQDKRFNKGIDNSTGFITRSVMCVPLITHRKTVGVLEVLNKLDEKGFGQQDLETMLSVAPTAAMATENTLLQQSILDGYKRTMKALASTIDAKDPYTRGHSQRVMDYALLAGVALRLPKTQLQNIEYAGILHDIGKIGVPDTVLTKSGCLTPEEWELLREHPVVGAKIIDDIPFLEKARPLVLYHHERYDGTGYPEGLKGEKIPIGARILSVVDAFDAITTERPYWHALPINDALKALHNCSGTQFCPEVTQAFISKLYIN